jgi:microcystin-dependent protein
MGTIILFAGSFAPNGWAFCDGRLLPIQQYSALFSILGTTYGGDGFSTFALPDLRGRTPIHQGAGPGLTDRQLGESGGAESVTLEANHLPAHTHAVSAVSGDAVADGPRALGVRRGTRETTSTTEAAGSGQPFSTQPPFLALNYIIAMEGIYPSRS